MTNRQKRWKALWNPDMYHGWGNEKDYFEGWYFKIVDPTENYAFAFIPGISLGETSNQHAFIQVLDGKKSTAVYHRFEKNDFIAAEDKFEVQLKGNSFSAQHLQLDLPEIKGELTFENNVPWPKMLYAPGIMGWFSFIPFMQCYHGIVSLNNTIKGQLIIDGEMVDFSQGKGYIEKDWGRSFPNAWIWMQSNHFDSKPTSKTVSLTASVAHIPWLGNHFIGYIVGFLLGEKLYRFATYTGAKMKASVVDDFVYLSFKDRKNRLEIKAIKMGGGDLISPIEGDMIGKVNESMEAIVEVKLYEKEQLIFEGTGKNTGMELAGDVDSLLTEEWRR